MKTVELSDEDIEFMRGVLDEFPDAIDEVDLGMTAAESKELHTRCAELRTKLWRAK